MSATPSRGSDGRELRPIPRAAPPPAIAGWLRFAALAVAVVVVFAAALGAALALIRPAQTPVSPRAAGTIAPVAALRAVESGSAVNDAAGGRWLPDRFAHGGSLRTSLVPIADTDAPALYRGQRVGIRSLDVPLRSPGNYLVVLYFAETAGAPPGGRVFQVAAQGRPVRTVDVAGEVGALTPYHLAFTVIVRHELTIGFIPRRGQTMLSAVKIAPVAAGVALPARHLAFADEFTGPAGVRPNPEHWRADLGAGWGQLATYTASAANAFLDGHGDLALAARRQPSGPGGRAARYTSARITTQGAFTMLYGEVSARVKVAGQPGVVSTFWGLGSDVARIGWPRSGEIDPMEVRGRAPQVLVQAVHTQCAGRRYPIVWERTTAGPLSAGFHTFTIERAPGFVGYLVDGRQTASLTEADLPRCAWVFDKPFFLILNLIVGGWGGTPSAAAHWPIEMLVDWVRGYV